MDSMIDGIIEFIRVRQLNFAVAGLLTIVYLLYQYSGVLRLDKAAVDGSEVECRHAQRHSRSRSRTPSRSRSRSGCNYKLVDSKQRRGRKSHRH